MTASVIVWDREESPPDAMGEVLWWRSYAHEHWASSIPRYLEDHAARLRTKYLAFIHDLGECRIGEKRVVDHLDMGDGFSLWWMTHLAEKSPFKSPRIYDCLRLLALEEMLLQRKPTDLTLDTADRDLAQAIGQLCRNLRIQFVWHPGGRFIQQWSPLRRVYRALPSSMQGVITFARYLLTRWSLRKLEKPQWFSGPRAVFLCSYFFALDQASCAEGRFYSRQWESLPNYLRDSGWRTNWIQHFLFSLKPDARTGLSWLHRFNRDAERQGCHAFLDSYLSWSIVIRVLKRLFWLYRVSWRLKRIHVAFYPDRSAVWLWPLLRDDWRASLSGHVGVCNCLWIELFDTALNAMPHQEFGLYLCENQGWERALLGAWRRHGHGQIIGVPHATVPFWHLNYFDDPRSLNLKQNCGMPLPNRVAVNGPMAWNAFVQAGYPVEQLVAVEALRYQYLAALGPRRLKNTDNRLGSTTFSRQGSPKAVLILGDFTVTETSKMLECVKAASLLLESPMSFTLKPHPACRVDPADWPAMPFHLTNKPLPEIVEEFDLVFSSNVTSAGLDAYLAGLPVIVFVDPGNFNSSPLRGVKGARFITTPNELAVALQADGRDGSCPALNDFFWLDTELPRWRKVLSGVRISR